MVKTRSGLDTRKSTRIVGSGEKKCDSDHGWSKRKPSKQQRQSMPLSCFLDPEHRKYPVCPCGSSTTCC